MKNQFAQEQSNNLFLIGKEIPSIISSFFVIDHKNRYTIEFWNPQKDFHLFMPLEEDFERMEKDPSEYISNYIEAIEHLQKINLL